jgi:hypothetical protein
LGLVFYEQHLQATISQALFDGFYFQTWHSDSLLQTVTIHSLREKGLISFWYLHIQPPLYDFIRYLLSFRSVGEPYILDGTSLDGRIYLFYCLIYGSFNQLIYLWFRAIGFQHKVSVLVTTLWATHPGNLAMATLLDSTYLSAFLIAWAIFLQYLYLREPSVRGLALFLGILLMASWTRTLFQLQFFILLLGSVVFCVFMFHRRDLVRASVVVLPLALAFFLLPLKQQYLYGTLSTTTSAGQHKVEGIWYRPTVEEINVIPVPKVYVENARRFQNKNNSVEQVVLNYRYERIFWNVLISEPAVVLDGLRKSLLQGLHRVWIPTQDYVSAGPNRLIETVPWVKLSRLLSGGLAYLPLILLGLVGYLLAIYYQLCDFRPRFLMIVGFIGLAFATIAVGSNRYEWTEAERLKFLIEAPLLLFSLQGIRLLYETCCIIIYAGVQDARWTTPGRPRHRKQGSSTKPRSRRIEPSDPIRSAVLDDETGGTARADV